MFCTNCGNQIPDDSVFCVHCGARVSDAEPAPVIPAEEQPQPVQEAIQWEQPEIVEPVEEKPQLVQEAPVTPEQEPPVQQPYVPPVAPKPVKPKKPVKVGPIIAIAAGAIVLVVALVLCYFMFWSPAAKLKQNLEAGDMVAAYEIYRDNFAGEDLNDENIAYLEAGANQAETDYMAGTITYQEAMNRLDVMRKFDMINRKLDKAAEKILIHAAEAIGDKVVDGSVDYKAAMDEIKAILAYEIEDVNEAAATVQLKILSCAAEQMQNRYLNNELSYDETVAALETLREYDVNGISDVVYQATSNMQTKRAVEQTLEAARAAMESADYISAINQYQNALNQDPENAAAAEGITAAKDAYRADMLASSNAELAQGDFDEAVSVLKTAMDVLGEEAQLTEAVKAIEAQEITQAIAAAKDAVAGGDFDAALELLAAMQEKYPSDQQLADTAEKIIAQRPVGMQDLEEIDALDIWYKNETIRDMFGNSYKGGMFLTYGDFKNTYAEYKLDGKYTRFTGKIIVSTDTRPDRRITYWIYLDDELVQTRENITIKTKPMDFDIDLTGAKTMKIVMKASGHIDTELYFVNTQIYKAAEK